MTKFILVNTIIKNGKVIGSTCIYDIPEHEINATAYELSRLNPTIKDNINFWKKHVQENGYYALAIELNEAKNSVEYYPLSKKDYEALVECAEKGGGGHKFNS